MKDGRSTDGPSVAGLVAGLGAFLLLGGAGTIYIWHVLNEILTGHRPEGSVWLALVVLLGLAVLVRALWSWLRRQQAGEA